MAYESPVPDAVLYLHVGAAIVVEPNNDAFLLTHDGDGPVKLENGIPVQFENATQGAHVAHMPQAGDYPYSSVKARLKREFEDFLTLCVTQAHSAAFDGTLTIALRSRLVNDMLEPVLSDKDAGFCRRLQEGLLAKTDRKPMQKGLEGLPLEGQFGELLRSIGWHRPNETETEAKAADKAD